LSDVWFDGLFCLDTKRSCSL